MTEGRAFPDAFVCAECGGRAAIYETLHWAAVCRYKCRACGATGYYVRDRPGTLPNIELQPVGLYGAITDDGTVSGADGDSDGDRDTASDGVASDQPQELPDEWREAQMVDHVPYVDEVIDQHPGLDGDALRIYNRVEETTEEWIRIATPAPAEQ
ncbi:MAG: hypothetical protein ABEI76_02230 [Halobacteriales archaeon]